MRTIGTTFAILMALLLLAGCSDRQLEQLPSRSSSDAPQSSSSEAQPQESSSAPAAEQPTNDWYNQTYISAISLYRLDDFESPEVIAPDAWVRYYLMANYDGPGKLPIPEGYRNQEDFSLLIPGEEVEDFLTAHFALEADYLRKAEGYVKSRESYGFGTLGLSTTALSQVTNVQQQGDDLSIIFDVYLQLDATEASDSPVLGDPVSTRIATITPSEGGFVVRSLQTLYQADLEALLSQPGAETE